MNRCARRARHDAWIPAAREELSRAFALDVRFPATPAAAAEEARRAASAGSVVIAAGGDGTLGLLSDALADEGGTLGILPMGTANDLARELRIPSDPRAAAARLASGTRHPTSLVAVDGHRFITVGGLGLVSASTLDVARLRAGPAAGLARLTGAGIYRLAATAGLFRPRITGGVRVTWHGPDAPGEQVLEADVHGLFVTNHATCGGGLVIPTGARADDRIFEIALIARSSRPRLVANLGRLSAGLPLAPGVFVVLRAHRAVIETEHDDTFVADGEPLARGRRFTLDSHPAALGILR